MLFGDLVVRARECRSTSVSGTPSFEMHATTWRVDLRGCQVYLRGLVYAWVSKDRTHGAKGEGWHSI